MKKDACFYGIYPIKFIWRGAWSDPLIRYKGHIFNYYSIEDSFYSIYKEEKEENEHIKPFEDWMHDNGDMVKSYLQDLINMGAYENE